MNSFPGSRPAARSRGRRVCHWSSLAVGGETGCGPGVDSGPVTLWSTRALTVSDLNDVGITRIHARRVLHAHAEVVRRVLLESADRSDAVRGVGRRAVYEEVRSVQRPLHVRLVRQDVVAGPVERAVAVLVDGGR